jgi:hypothetical protein
LLFEFNNDFGFTNQDEYRVTSQANEDFNGLEVSYMTLAMYDADGTVFNDDHFRGPMAFAEAEQRQFMIQFAEGLDSGNSGPGPGPISSGSTAMAFGTLTSVSVQ